MKRLLTLAMSAAVMALAVPTASAEPWMGINHRQAELDQRIDVGVHNGSLPDTRRARCAINFMASPDWRPATAQTVSRVGKGPILIAASMS